MLEVDFASLPLWQNVAVFLVAAGIIWLAGSRLAVYADIIADRTGLGQAFVGLLLLAVATSLPEIGRTIGASLMGNAPIAVNSLFGGVPLQTAILAIADLSLAGVALTYFAPSPVLLLQGATVVLLLGFSVAGMAAGEVLTLFHVGLWPAVLAVMYGVSIYALRRYESREQWRPVNVPDELEEQIAKTEALDAHGVHTLRHILLRFGLSSLGIFGAGLTLAQVGDALALQTGLGAGFIGATLLALASALPEMAVTLAAVRLGAFSMAIANVFGTNAFLVALLLLADLFYLEGPILEAVDPSALFTAAAGIVTTSIYLVGLIERRNQRILGMGMDSAMVLALYAGVLVILYRLG